MMTYEDRIEKAKQHNAALDSIDHKLGRSTPAEMGAADLFATGMEAIKAGLSREDFDMVAEGFVMLCEVGNTVWPTRNVRVQGKSELDRETCKHDGCNRDHALFLVTPCCQHPFVILTYLKARGQLVAGCPNCGVPFVAYWVADAPAPAHQPEVGKPQ